MHAKKPRVAERPIVFRRATYYLRPDQIRALRLRAATQERQLSELMREAVDFYLEQARRTLRD